jgi:hypothetical protein
MPPIWNASGASIQVIVLNISFLNVHFFMFIFGAVFLYLLYKVILFKIVYPTQDKVMT